MCQLAVFFFQAEDGIRDADGLEFRRVLFRSYLAIGSFAPEQKALQHLLRAEAAYRQIQVAFGSRGGQRGGGGGEIGRASCRGRVEIWVEGGSEKGDMGRKRTNGSGSGTK